MSHPKKSAYFLAYLLGAGCWLLLAGNLAAQAPLRQRQPSDRIEGNARRFDREALSRTTRGVHGPVLGFLWSGSSALTPVLGIPGAATMGRPLQGLPKAQSAVVSAERGYAVVISAKRQALLVRNLRGIPSRVPLASLTSKADLAVISPAGSAVALLNRATGVVTVLKYMPSAPQLAWHSETATLPGPISAMAVSDDGTAVLAAAGEGTRRTVILLTVGNHWRYISAAGAPVSVGFLANRADGIFSDGASSEVFLVRDPSRSAAIRLLAGPGEGISHPVAVAAARDNSKVIIANADPGGIVSVALDGSAVTTLACRCRPTGLERMNGNFVFRLREAGDAPVRLFDGDAVRPRIVVVPPAAARTSREGGKR